jgi:hypothetical protein
MCKGQPRRVMLVSWETLPDCRGQWHKLCVTIYCLQFPHIWKQVLWLIISDKLVALELYSQPSPRSRTLEMARVAEITEKFLSSPLKF